MGAQSSTIPAESPLFADETKEINGRTIVKKVMVPPQTEQKLAFTLDGVFTEEECNEWIRITEEKGYEIALVNIGGGRQKLMEDVRNNMRCIIDSPEMAKKIWDYIHPFLPEIWQDEKITVSCLNERLRFLRYDPGQKFEPHMDGMYRREDGSETSYITVQLYLNEGFDGGSTTFLGQTDEDRLECVPKIGRVLIFEHRLLHEGSALIKGRKYAVRTDVMYDTSRIG